MLRLKQHLLSALNTRVPLPPPAASLHGLSLSTTTASTSAATPPAGFVAEDYLVTTCGLTPAQALKASKYFTNVRSPDKPDAVRAFLVGIGVAEADVTAAIARYPPLLRGMVGETLAPRIVQLREMGLSLPQISSLIAVSPEVLFSSLKISRLAFYLSFLGSYDRVQSALKRSIYLFGQNVETVVRPNIAFLNQCGLSDSDIGKYFLLRSRILLLDTQRVKELAVRAEELGVPRNSAMFKQALLVVNGLNPLKLNARLDFLMKVIGCSEAELFSALRKLPNILTCSEDKIGRTVEFLKVEVGLEPSYLLPRPAMFTYSIERRLMPRHYVLKVLKARGLLKKETDFFGAVCPTEMDFAERFLLPYNKSVPGLVEAYAALCAGKVPPEL